MNDLYKFIVMEFNQGGNLVKEHQIFARDENDAIKELSERIHVPKINFIVRGRVAIS